MKHIYCCILVIFLFANSDVKAIYTCTIGYYYWKVLSIFSDSLFKSYTSGQREKIKHLATEKMLKHNFCLPENCMLPESENESDNQEIIHLTEFIGIENIFKTIQVDLISERTNDITTSFRTPAEKKEQLVIQ